MRQKRDYDETLSAFDVLADKTMQDDLVSRLRRLEADLAQFKDKSVGSIRIDLDEVRAICGAADRITALEASLAAAEARGYARGLEEAARVAEQWMQGSALSGDCATEDAQRTGRHIAQAIRALMENSNADVD